jgi:hypothetical protein
MIPLLMVQWGDLGGDNMRTAVASMADDLEVIVQAIRRGESTGQLQNAGHWIIETEVSFDEIKRVLNCWRREADRDQLWRHHRNRGVVR